MNGTLQTIHSRTSLRRYKDISIKEEHLEALLSATLRAPTAGNMMLYTVIAITDQEMKNTLSKTCDNQPFIAKAPLLLVFLADYQRWFDYYLHSGVSEFCKKTGYDFQGADLGDLFIAINDALIAAQTAVLAAESLGIGSCYIGDIMENYEIHRELLDLPEYVVPITMLCLGYYPDNYQPRYVGRFPQEYIIHREKYHRLDEKELEDMFQAEEKRFPASNKFGAENLGQFFYARKTGSAFAKEMSRSMRVALQNWQGSKL